MRVVIRINRRRADPAAGIFQPRARRRGLWPWLASSAVLHAAAAAGIFAVAACFERLFPYQDFFPSTTSVMLARTGAADDGPLYAPPAEPSRPAEPPPPASSRPHAAAPAQAPSSAPLSPAPASLIAPPLSPPQLGEFSTVFVPFPPFIGVVLPGFAPPDPAPFQPDPPAGVLRKIHPASGVYDVVIVQSSGAEPGDSRILKGAPVFVVYLDIGLPKMSMLQYATAIPQGPVINLAETGALDAPYPKLTLIPKTIQTLGESILIHGFVTAAGRLRDVSILGGADGASALLALLQDWIFRPARRGDRPVEVEILLTI